MGHYRTINVDGTDYQYTQGRYDLHVRGFGTVNYGVALGFRGIPSGIMHDIDERRYRFTPQDVANYIRRRVAA